MIHADGRTAAPLFRLSRLFKGRPPEVRFVPVPRSDRSVQVLYFAALRDLTGRAEEQLELPAEVETVRDLVRHLQQIRPALAGKLVSVRVALDEAFAKDSDALAGARVIALIPPVAGG